MQDAWKSSNFLWENKKAMHVHRTLCMSWTVHTAQERSESTSLTSCWTWGSAKTESEDKTELHIALQSCGATNMQTEPLRKDWKIYRI